MLGVVVGLRLYLHLVHVQHVYPGGYLVHHLFTGVLILSPSAFCVAFAPRRRPVAIAARVALGIGSGLVLDEITYLVMTKASDDDYVSQTSWLGSVGFVALAVILLWIIFKSNADLIEEAFPSCELAGIAR